MNRRDLFSYLAGIAAIGLMPKQSVAATPQKMLIEDRWWKSSHCYEYADGVLREVYGDLAVYGTGAMMIDENMGFKHVPLSQMR